MRATTPLGRFPACIDARSVVTSGASPEQRQVPLDDEDEKRARAAVEDVDVRALAADRFPVIDRAPFLVDELLELHTPRQLVALVAILERIEGDLRAAPVLAALRLAFLHAVLPSSRLATGGNRNTALRMRAGHVRVAGGTWRERNPWLAFEDAFALIRGFVQGLDGGALGPLPARLGEDLRSLGEGSATTVLSLAGPSAMRALRDETPAYERLVAVPGSAWSWASPHRDPAANDCSPRTTARPGRSAGRRPACCPSRRCPIRWFVHRGPGRRARSVARLTRSSRLWRAMDGSSRSWRMARRPSRRRPWGASARYRLVVARLRDPDDDIPGVVEFVPPGAPLPPGPRTRANVGLEPVPGARAIPSWSRPGVCSPHLNDSTSAPSRRWRRPGS
ncbi:MAG: hypothetical protein WKF78_03865 [Candidatus Limnocylindrales bacterium]